MRIKIARRFAGPPTMGHGGYVAGLFASRTKGAVQVTLRRPVPLDTELQLVEIGGGQFELRNGDDIVVESASSALTIDAPRPPTLDQARAAEADSPALYNGGRGVHPTCFGCGRQRDPGDALRIFAGPLSIDGVRQVAGVWRPGDEFATADGSVDTHWVAAALDCPGAFAFIVDDMRAGLLGRITFEQYEELRADNEYVVTGWRIGEDGRKLFAGTALFDADGRLLAAAHATWFQPVGRRV